MVNYGAYGRKEFYTVEQVKSIVQYANLNGKSKMTSQVLIKLKYQRPFSLST